MSVEDSHGQGIPPQETQGAEYTVSSAKPTVEPRIKGIEARLGPNFLKMLAQVQGSSGFRYRPDPNLPLSSVGHTDMKTLTIYYNPRLIEGDEALGIKPLEHPEGFFYHEAGHHAPPVLELDHKLTGDLKNVPIPKDYQGDVKTEERFLRSIDRNLYNSLLDIWLEGYLGRSPFYPIRAAFKTFYHELGEPNREFFAHFSKPEKLLQAILSVRYKEIPEIQEKFKEVEVDSNGNEMVTDANEDVYEAFKKITQRPGKYTASPLEVIMDNSDFEAFPTPAGMKAAIQRKFETNRDVILPLYLQLIENELEKRKQQRQQEKGQNGEGEPQEGEGQEGEGQNGEGSGEQQGEGKGKQGKKGKPGKGTPQKGNQQSGGGRQDSAVPLTPEEEKEIAMQYLDELDKAGSDHRQTPSPEEQAEFDKAMKDLKDHLEKLKKGEKDAPAAPKAKEEDGTKKINKLQDEMLREAKERQQRGLAEAMQVRQESIATWEEIKEEFAMEIAAAESVIAEVFLHDRRSKIAYLQRMGEVVPGLEYEDISAQFSGDLDPDTKMRIVRNPEFIETEVEFITDTSGSMSGERLRQSVNTMVVVYEGFKRVKEDLARENLLGAGEEPLRIGGTKFSVTPERVTTPEEPLTDEKELKMIDEFSKVGGGTDESGAIEEVSTNLAEKPSNVIKIMIIFSDGEGNRAAVAPLIEKIEDNDEIVLLAVGMGAHAQAIVDTYIEPLKKPEGESNVFGIAAEDVSTVLPQVLEFIQKQVEERRTY